MASPCDGSDHESPIDDGSVTGLHDPCTTLDEEVASIDAELAALLQLTDPLQQMEARN